MSYALYRMMAFSMTYMEPYLGFQGHGTFMWNISGTFWPMAYGQVTMKQ